MKNTTFEILIEQAKMYAAKNLWYQVSSTLHFAQYEVSQKILGMKSEVEAPHPQIEDNLINIKRGISYSG
jgi:hypothetical protein